jgi:nitrate/nitrite transport system ATP-binding protein
MTNGPQARVAESVKVSIPRPRNRTDIIHHPGYYKIRNHLVDFLVNRSKALSGSADSAEVADSKHPLLVDPTLEAVKEGGVNHLKQAAVQRL